MPLRPPRRANLVEQFLDLSGQMAPLTPAAHRVLLSRPAGLPQQATRRVPQQTDVRRVMHVRLDHERITPPAQWLAKLFFSDLVTALHTTRRPTADNSSGVNKRHVVDYRLVFVTRLVIEITVSQELTYRPVMVRQVVKTVEVAAQPLLQHPQHQNLPQGPFPEGAALLRRRPTLRQRGRRQLDPSRRGEGAAEGTGGRWYLCGQRRLGVFRWHSRAWWRVSVRINAPAARGGLRTVATAAKCHRAPVDYHPVAGQMPTGLQ